MVKFPNISGPSNTSGPLPDNNETIPGPESYTLPRHHGGKTEGLVVDGPLKACQALDKRGILNKTSPELEVKIEEMTIYALAEIAKKLLPPS